MFGDPEQAKMMWKLCVNDMGKSEAVGKEQFCALSPPGTLSCRTEKEG